MSYIIITPFFPNKSSYAGSYLLDQAKEIDKQIDTNVSVIILDNFFSKAKDYKIEGIQCYIFKKLDFPSFLFPGFFQKFNNKRLSNFLNKKQISVDKESIVHGHINYPSSPFLAFLKIKFNCKTILQHHGLDVLQFDTGRINIFKKIRNNIIRKKYLKNIKLIDFHLGVSKLVLKKLYAIDDSIKEKSYVLYNGVDTSKFYPVIKKNKTFKIGCVANFWELKDQITLIKSLQELNKQKINDWQCEFIGVGPTKKYCMNYVKLNNIPNITFLDKVPHNDLNDFYNELSLFVLPSYYEALGCVYLESWATDTPFIAIKNQGIEELLKHDQKQKLLIDKEDYSNLSEKIIYFKNNPQSFSFDRAYKIENLIHNFLLFIKNN